MAESRAPNGNPTIADVAEAAGASTATGSRALNHRPDFCLETSERIERVAFELGYRGRHGPRNRRRPVTRYVNLLAHAVDDEYIGAICRGIMDQRDPNLLQLVLHLTDAKVTREADHVRIARRTGNEG